uniref:LRRNT domain-containing protein n=1 Tax=Branchiostoma floridae TaxID=7739 RepID=C3XV25_BRAFL|eukprot:XP_002611942.1 hypothetical protein BRAFLDRAFT_91826 [Branchiostoma floridae]
MGRKLRYVLVFLLIILKEPNMPEAGCKSKCESASVCGCDKMGLTSIPQDLPTNISCLELFYNKIKTLNGSELTRYRDLTKLHLNYNQITTIQFSAVSKQQQEDQTSFTNCLTKDVPDWTGGHVQTSKQQQEDQTSFTKCLTKDVPDWTGGHVQTSKENMGRKMHYVLIFLVIILKAPNTEEAGCRCESSFCRCNKMGLTSIPQDLPTSISRLNLYTNKIKTLNGSELTRFKDINPKDLNCVKSTVSIVSGQLESGNNSYNGTTYQASHYQWYFKQNSGSTARPVHIVGTTFTTLPDDPSKPDTEMNNSHESVPILPLPVLIVSVCGPIAVIALIGAVILTIWYKRRTKNPPSGQNTTCSATNTTTCSATVVTNDHDPQYEDIDRENNQATPESNTNTTAAVVHVTCDHVKTGNDQSQAITEPTKNTAATVMTSGYDQTGQGQSQAITEPTKNTAATVMTSGYDQAGQGQSQQSTDHGESLDTRNPIYTTEPAASEGNHVYNCENDQAGKDQTQANADESDGTAVIYATEPAASEGNPVYNCENNQAGKDQTQANADEMDGKHENMWRKLNYVLVFLLIILKEPNMAEAGCRSRCEESSSSCHCYKMDLTNIPQDLPTSISRLNLYSNKITTLNGSELASVFVGRRTWGESCITCWLSFSSS